MARVGVFAGTFDPVHDGHVAFALAAVQEAGLRKVVLLPERQPRGKVEVTSFGHRLAMLRLASSSYSQLEVVELGDRQFSTPRTLPKLRELFGKELSLLVGSDVVRTFAHRWPDLAHLLEQMQLVVALRKDDLQGEIEEVLHNVGANFSLIHSPDGWAASSTVRSKAAHTMLHPAVLEYITVQQLYWLARPAN